MLEAMPYIQDFRGSHLRRQVRRQLYGGPGSGDLHGAWLYDIAFLAAVGINVVVVHGGGKAITKAMEESVPQRPTFVNGMRVTDEATVAIVKKTLDEIVNRRRLRGERRPTVLRGPPSDSVPVRQKLDDRRRRQRGRPRLCRRGHRGEGEIDQEGDRRRRLRAGHFARGRGPRRQALRNVNADLGGRPGGQRAAGLGGWST